MDNITENLKNNLEQLSIIFNSVPAWIFYKDKENRFIKVNKAFCDAMGKQKQDFEGKSLFDLFPNDEADRYWKDDLEVINSKKSKTGIIESIHTTKGVRWLRTDKIPYFDEYGTIIGVIGFAIDITDRVNAEDSIKKSQFILQNIIDLLPIRIFWKDLNLKYLGCNIAFAKDGGKTSPNELIGKDDYEMTWKDQAEAYRSDDFAVIKSGTPKLNYEEEQTTPAGGKIYVITNKVPLKNNLGEIIGVLGTYVDITERKHNDESLKQALLDTKRMNELMVDRELKMIDLKKRIEELESHKTS